jgi:hypothetical protein
MEAIRQTHIETAKQMAFPIASLYRCSRVDLQQRAGIHRLSPIRPECQRLREVASDSDAVITLRQADTAGCNLN